MKPRLSEIASAEHQRRMDIVGGIVWACRKLWHSEKQLAEAFNEANSTLRSVWMAGTLVGSLAAIWIFTRTSIDGLSSLGWLGLVGTSSIYLNALVTSRSTARKIESIQWRIWDRQARWIENGGSEDHLTILRQLWQSDLSDIDVHSEEYRNWWRTVDEWHLARSQH